MAFDALTLTAVREELEPLLTGGRLQKLVLVDELSLAVECFTPGTGRTNLLLSADLEQGRVQRTRQLPARGVERESPFGLLVRKHLRNARLSRLYQPRLERVFELHCEQRDSSDRPYRVVLIVEVMGRRSNLILVDGDGLILDAARRTPPSRSRRPILPHLPYTPPPPQDRLLPEELSPETLKVEDGLALDKVLAQRVAGLSPLAAREIAFRAAGRDLVEVARQFLSVLDTHQWSPSVAFDATGPLEYAPYVLTHLQDRAQVQHFATISDALDAFYAQTRTRQRGDPLAGERKTLLAAVERAAKATTRRIAALEHQLQTGQSTREPLRRAGDLLLIHQLEIPPGADEVVLDGIRVELDRELSAVDNAQAYFARYRKARETEERVPRLLDEARQQAEYLAELQALVEVADQMDAIRALRAEVAAATGTHTRARSSSKATPYRRVPLEDGWEALVGTSAEGNAKVTFDLANGEDLWLHARGVPGAHVILRGPGDPSADILERAASLAAALSGARSATSVEVDVTSRKYVKKVPRAPQGLVRYTNERTLRVTPRA